MLGTQALLRKTRALLSLGYSGKGECRSRTANRANETYFQLALRLAFYFCLILQLKACTRQIIVISRCFRYLVTDYRLSVLKFHSLPRPPGLPYTFSGTISCGRARGSCTVDRWVEAETFDHVLAPCGVHRAIGGGTTGGALVRRRIYLTPQLDLYMKPEYYKDGKFSRPPFVKLAWRVARMVANNPESAKKCFHHRVSSARDSALSWPQTCGLLCSQSVPLRDRERQDRAFMKNPLYLNGQRGAWERHEVMVGGHTPALEAERAKGSIRKPSEDIFGRALKHLERSERAVLWGCCIVTG